MQYTFQGHQIEIVYSGAPGWFDFYINGHPRGCARANEIKSRIHNIIQTELIKCKPDCHCANCRPDLFKGSDLNDRELAKYQPKIILDAITNALGK